MPVRRHRPLHTPAPCFLELTPTRLQSHGCLLASLFLPTSLCYPGMSDAKTQHQLPTPYPETSFGIAVRHSGEPMVAPNRVLPVPSSTPFPTARLPTLAWKGRPGLASFYPLSHPGTADGQGSQLAAALERRQRYPFTRPPISVCRISSVHLTMRFWLCWTN